MSQNTVNPSDAARPDLDWSQVRETVRMLSLAVGQIRMAMQDSDESVGTLTACVTNMINNVNAIDASAKTLPDDDEAREIKDTIVNDCIKVQGGIQEVVMAFQFYDKLSQRMSHVEHELNELTTLVGDSSRLFNPMEWKNLQDNIRSRYSMAEEQHMFDALLSGASVEEALQYVRQKLDEGSIDDIELF